MTATSRRREQLFDDMGAILSILLKFGLPRHFIENWGQTILKHGHFQPSWLLQRFFSLQGTVFRDSSNILGSFKVWGYPWSLRIQSEIHRKLQISTSDTILQTT